MTDAPEPRTFAIRSCLGRGGFGEVYLATMTSGVARVHSDVALKVLKEGADPDGQAAARLRDEGRVLGLLQHPTILHFYGLTLLNGRITLVTEYVAGADLSHCLTAVGPLPARVIAEALGRVAAALESAWHTPGPHGMPLQLLHRDIKPSNIRLGRHGEVKLLDFGVAKGSDEALGRDAHTRTDATIGTQLYMAPERFDSGGGARTSDVYSLGSTLYEALTGTRLFGGLAQRHRYGLAFDRTLHDRHVAARLDALPASVPGEVAALLGQTLRFEADDRPIPAELSLVLEELAEDLPGDPLRRWARSFAWPDEAPTEGGLEGQLLTESALPAKPPPAAPSQASPARDGDVTRRRWLVPVLLAAVGGAALLWCASPPTPSPQAQSQTPSQTPGPIPSPPEPTPAMPAPVEAVPPSSPEPAPDAMPPPPEPPPARPSHSPPASRIRLDGDAVQLTLLGEDGSEVQVARDHAFRQVPPGTYRMTARFPSGHTTLGPEPVVLGTEEDWVVNCKAGFFTCTARRTEL